MLFVIEKVQNSDFEIDFDELTVEHILPQDEYEKLTSNWRDNFTSTEHEKLCHTIGNCTILTRDENSSISKNNFISKKQIYLNSGFYLNEKIAEFDNWNKESILGYSDQIIELVSRRWENIV